MSTLLETFSLPGAVLRLPLGEAGLPMGVNRISTTDDAEITALIQAARVAAVADVGEIPATPENLSRLAGLVRLHVLMQVIDGQWSRWEVTLDQMLALRVTARLNKSGAGPEILIEEDFSRTRLKFLQVTSVAAE